MRKILLTTFFAFSLFWGISNPVMPHPIAITEFYIDSNNNWVIELKNSFDYPGVSNFDNLRLTTSSGSYYFKQGINISPYQIVLINNDSLTTPMVINRNNDYIKLEKNYGSGFWLDIGFDLSFGNNPYYSVGPIALNQSVELYHYTISSGLTYCYVKSSVASLGVYPAPNIFNNSKGTLQGYVYDENHVPYVNKNIGVYYVPYPDTYPNNNFIPVNQQTGFFSRELFSCKYRVSIILKGSKLSQFDSIIDIEPGQTFNYIYEGNLVEIKTINDKDYFNISNFPNPVTDITNFSITYPNIYSKALIKIYNANGEIIKILPAAASKNKETQTLISLNIKNDGAFKPGVYYYALELDGKKTCSGKMIVIN